MTSVVFMGTPAFSVPILKGLIENEYEIKAVVTQPDRPVGRKKVLTPPPVKEAAVELGIPVLQPEKISGSEEMQQVLDLDPDIIVTAAFGQFLPEKLLYAPEFGSVNVHASLLPKYRGGAPVHYALMNGEKETGVTIMRMVKKMDAGDILTQAKLEIKDTDDVGTLFDRLSVLGKDLLLETLPMILTNTITPTPQKEEDATFSPNISRELERISWDKTAEQVDWQVRGMHPWPVAHTLWQEQRVKIYQGQPLEKKTNAKPGTIVTINKKSFEVACGDGTVYEVLTLQPAGKAKMSAVNFLNGVGRQLNEGDQLTW
ncbi:methionyl-tRNA formyltransferase [Vagococcus lutrae]|uniref:Methionyl-tRNA formyltransferase n=1 Tax=Vagococcus lutrae LBD1 TaxID=1408226 RepID=V6Q4Z3_9ENTE|nr:methionyl-tRNA formyltransferase [Vagococcus lutrae]EST90194.1 methionyl-tRNA formyltransferase [Vagococcus lutrae LBD1]MDT2816741.1 methionyl-tRNA formyltransferase [Vagococcus lutrae]MDT2825481.1 methionyl-tRNA formyltransferase [Vagococcus lutrae]NKZ28356.1 methionyl-tRNA formyltransferase [Vagococcus lutrae]UQF23096.1 methionyl-tRNA formyltransferase [Vagococcus lutrae]